VRKRLAGAGIFLLMMCLMCFACAEEAENITAGCKWKSSSTKWKYTQMTDGKYTTSWDCNETKHPFVTISSDTPMYGLYLCFKQLPTEYEIQVPKGDGWKKLCDGETRFVHCYYDLAA